MNLILESIHGHILSQQHSWNVTTPSVKNTGSANYKRKLWSYSTLGPVSTKLLQHRKRDMQ